jgi:hypothetical protein
MAHSLEAPGTDEAPEFSSLYRARGADEVVVHRPIFTGDVFFGVPVIGEEAPRDVIVLQHPCAIRRGVELAPKLLVAEIAADSALAPSKWSTGHYKKMPLPELQLDDDPKHYAAFFERHQLVLREDLNLELRKASMSQRGVNLLMQRWVHHNSRVIVPTQDYQDVTGAQYEEADIIEEWCVDRDDDGVPPETATMEIDIWLGTGDPSPRKRLDDLQQRSAVRREVRAALKAARVEGKA